MNMFVKISWTINSDPRLCFVQFRFLLHCLIVMGSFGRCNLLQLKIKFKVLIYRSLPLSHTDGCPGLCNGNGQCIMGQNSWRCECHTGWRGTGCSVAMEISCNDNKDNEGGENQFQPAIKTEPRETLESYSNTLFLWRNSMRFYCLGIQPWDRSLKGNWKPAPWKRHV